MKRTSHRSRLYRIGGDEFVMITFGNHEGMTKYMLDRILNEDFSGEYNERLGKVSFAHGSADYTLGRDLQEIIELADSRMYEKKKAMKQAEAAQNNEKV